MKTVPDANIYISALLWGGNPGEIIRRGLSGHDDLFITVDILNEIRGVLSRPKFHLDDMEIEYYMELISEIAGRVFPRVKIKNLCRDADDDKYIECAIEAGAQYIISGDDDLLAVKEYNGIKILTAKDYLAIVYPRAV